jgi:hypothetical protein
MMKENVLAGQENSGKEAGIHAPATARAIEAHQQEAEAVLLRTPFFQKNEQGFAPYQVSIADYVRLEKNAVSDKEINYLYGGMAEKQLEQITNAEKEKSLASFRVADADGGNMHLTDHFLVRLGTLSGWSLEAYMRGYADLRDNALITCINEYLDEAGSPAPKAERGPLSHTALIMQGEIERGLEDPEVHAATVATLIDIARNVEASCGIRILDGVDIERLEVQDPKEDREHLLMTKTDIVKKIREGRIKLAA